MEQLEEIQGTDYFPKGGQMKGHVSKGSDGTEIAYRAKKKITQKHVGYFLTC